MGPGDDSAEQKVEQGHDKEQARQAPEQPVSEFHIIDELELVEIHAVVDELIFRGLAVFGELAFPGAGAQRRHDAGDDVPLDDRQSRTGQPNPAPVDDEHYDEGRDGE